MQCINLHNNDYDSYVSLTNWRPTGNLYTLECQEAQQSTFCFAYLNSMPMKNPCIVMPVSLQLPYSNFSASLAENEKRNSKFI